MALCNPLPIDNAAAPWAVPGELDVRILMFGMICQVTAERQTTLRLPQDATVRDVVSALGDRYGAAFLGLVMRTASRKASHSAIAVDGHIVRDLDQPVAPAGTAATVEIILLTGHEGRDDHEDGAHRQPAHAVAPPLQRIVGREF
jgi:hypothetical protein